METTAEWMHKITVGQSFPKRKRKRKRNETKPKM